MVPTSNCESFFRQIKRKELVLNAGLKCKLRVRMAAENFAFSIIEIDFKLAIGVIVIPIETYRGNDIMIEVSGIEINDIISPSQSIYFYCNFEDLRTSTFN